MITTIFQDNKAYITGEKIDPAIVFDCGQCFRFEKTEDVFHGIAFGQELFCKNESDAFVIWPVTEDSFHKIWRQYFDLDYDYNEIDNCFMQDEILAKTVIKGMRILHQEPFETLISFIISANNNIKRIKKNIDMICRAAGKKIGEDLYTFPTPEELAKLSIDDLRELGLGYRAPYIVNTTKQILGGFSLEKIDELHYADAKKTSWGFLVSGQKWRIVFCFSDLESVKPSRRMFGCAVYCCIFTGLNRKTKRNSRLLPKIISRNLPGLHSNTSLPMQGKTISVFNFYDGGSFHLWDARLPHEPVRGGRSRGKFLR
ncbi:MAG: hypothetical protein J6D00_06405 [Christensenellaceae bacterium]|nr:hypothetical protein [Christensenellaceae bacterium]